MQARLARIERALQLDRRTIMRQPWGGSGGGDVEVAYGYDVQDHLTQMTDGEGTVTSWVYSDRDLMTEEISEVSGVTSWTYDASGVLATKTDARGITMAQTTDALDRVTFVDYPDDALDVAYTYDDPAVPFSQGRLTRIFRDGHAIDYRYDRFGRMTQDGELIYAYDGNGNRTEITYPDGSLALYTHDYADREHTLDLIDPTEGPQPIVTDAAYKPFGPLHTLDLGNGLVETHDFDGRYYPTRITVAGASTLLDWDYDVDAVGNVTYIDDLLDADPAHDRDYGYQDVQYYLTQGDGPWGTLAWTYDRIGNRLSETRDGGPADVYVYEANLAGGSSPKLDFIQLGIGGQRDFSYDAAGNQTQIDSAGNVTDFGYDDAGRLSLLSNASADLQTVFRYDGRGFLREAEQSVMSLIFEDGFETGDTGCWSGSCPAPNRTNVTGAAGTSIYSAAESGHVNRPWKKRPRPAQAIRASIPPVVVQ